MKSPRSYSDPEIARYVLGLDMPERTPGIQALLAHNDAAAARALKWEAYLLGIVDALPRATPPETLLLHIQQTLGMTFDAPLPSSADAVLGDTREQDPAGTQPSTPRARSTAWFAHLHWPFGKPKMSRRALAASIAAAVIVIVIAGVLISANLHAVHPTVVHETVPAQTR